MGEKSRIEKGNRVCISLETTKTNSKGCYRADSQLAPLERPALAEEKKFHWLTSAEEVALHLQWHHIGSS